MKSVISIIVIVCSTPPLWGAEMIKNGSFEEDADGNGMADHWQFAGDKDIVVTWGRDTGYEEQFSQRLTCTSFTSRNPASHAMLCQVGTLNLKKGQWYKISFAAKQKGIPGRAVQVAISNTKSWTNCGLQESFRVSSEWKSFEFVFRATQTISESIRLQFWFTSTGTLWLDEAQLQPSEPVRKKVLEMIEPLGSVNLLPNSSFRVRIKRLGEALQTSRVGEEI